jgi:hypothetical protein
VVLSGLALLAVCGLGSYFVLVDEWQGRSMRAAEASPAATVRARDIGSRSVDPAPLTVKEVFPARTLVIATGEPAYQVLKTQAASDCRTAAVGEISDLLQRVACSQVVRGTLRSPDGGYALTAGVFNLPDAAAAEQAHEKIKPMVSSGSGRFQGMPAGTGTEGLTLVSAQAGWHVRGHFLVYCVIAKADGLPIDANDPYARQILFELIERHLRGTVLERRATVPVSPPAPTQPG